MTFEWALSAMKDGKRVRCRVWGDGVNFGITDDGTCQYFTRRFGEKVLEHDVCLQLRSILAEDWEEYAE